MLNDRANLRQPTRFGSGFPQSLCLLVCYRPLARGAAVALFSSPLALERLSEASLHLSLIGRNRSTLGEVPASSTQCAPTCNSLAALLLCGALRAAAAFTPKSTIRVKCPALQAQQDDESRSRRGRRRERKKDAVAIDAPAVDAPRKKIKRPAFLEKKPRRKAEPKPEAPIQEEERTSPRSAAIN